jgi:hypothetical protein
VFVTATNVRTGRARTFSQPELTVDSVIDLGGRLSARPETLSLD